jgi:hypothetical protein
MIEKILKRLAKVTYPERDISVEKIGKRIFMFKLDTVGCNNYLLDGRYSYDEVIALNNLTGYLCGFGFCKEIGPVAFIGVCNPHFCTNSGYFQYNVHEYGTSRDDSEYYWEVYSDEVAREIGNYTVYGFFGIEAVATKAPIAKIRYIYDSRYKCKKDMGHNEEKTIIEMDLKLSGTYSFDEARLLATGTTKDKDGFSGEEHPIQFAVVGDNQYVGIINLWEQDDNFKFRDVWEYGCDEPELQEMRFLSKNEAKKINNFSLYVYICPYSLKTKKYPIEKKDRTFDSRFNFHLPDGKDFRLI